MDAKKLMNQRNYIMKHKKITETEVEEMRRELQESQRSHLEEREDEELEHSGTIRVGEQKLDRRRNGNSSTKESDSQIKRKN